MKKMLYVLSVVLPLIAVTAKAVEKPSCDDLTQLADDLDMIAAGFAEAGTIVEGDDIDSALGEVVDALILLAETEDEDVLYDSVESLTDAYNQMDSERFGLSIDSVIANLDRLYRRDCI